MASLILYFDFTVWPDHFIIFFEFFVAKNVAFGDLKKMSGNTVMKVISMTQFYL